MLPMTMGLLFVSLLVVALVADIAGLQTTYRIVAGKADRISEGAAAMIDADVLQTEGVVELNADAAAARARTLGIAEGVTGDDLEVDVDGAAICVEIVQRYEPFALRVVAGRSIDVAVRSCAEPSVG